MLGGKNDAPLLCRRNARACAAIVGVATQTYLDKDERFPVATNQVDFTTATAKVAHQYGQSAFFEKTCRQILGEFAGDVARVVPVSYTHLDVYKRQALGLLFAFVFMAIHKRLGDPFIEVLTSLVVPYTAYITAESIHVSGVLAVVAAGPVRGRYAPRPVSYTHLDVYKRQMLIHVGKMANTIAFVMMAPYLSIAWMSLLEKRFTSHLISKQQMRPKA